MTTEVSKRVRGKRSIRLADCTDLLIVIESGNAPNIHWQFGSAPVEPAQQQPTTMKVDNVAPPTEAPKRGGRRRKAQTPVPEATAAPAPQAAPANNAPAAETPKKKGGFKFRGKDQELPAALCSAQRILEYKGKSGNWNTYAVVGSDEVKKEGGKWTKGTKFIKLRYIAYDEQERGMIVGSTFLVRESDFQGKVRNVRRFNPAQDNCGCDLCQSQ